MNRNVRKITEGAMMIAIIGVLLFFNRQFAGVLTLYLVLILPVPLIVYGVRYNVRDLLTVSASLLFLVLILSTGIGDIAYGVMSILLAVVYAANFKAKKSKTVILLNAVLVTAVGEVLVLVLFSGLMGIDINQEVLTLVEMVEQIVPQADMNVMFGDGLMQLMYILFIISTMLTGVLEAVIVHFLSNLILRRLGFEYIPPTRLIDIRIPKVWSYIMFLSLVAYGYFYPRIEIDLIRNLVSAAVAISSIVLFAFGFIAVVVYFKVSRGINATFILLLLCIFLSTVLMPAMVVCGFLYTATDIRTRLIEGGFNNESKI